MANIQKRREGIINILNEKSEPVSGMELAKLFGVTRQVIVQDIAILRTKNKDIISTNSGYIIKKADGFSKIFLVNHGDSDIEDELNTIVDFGGHVLDVRIKHKNYGEIVIPLNIRSRRDVRTFMTSMENGESKPLNILTEGYHYHIIRAASQEVLKEIEKELKDKGYLVVQNNK